MSSSGTYQLIGLMVIVEMKTHTFPTHIHTHTNTFLETSGGDKVEVFLLFSILNSNAI